MWRGAVVGLWLAGAAGCSDELAPASPVGAGGATTTSSADATSTSAVSVGNGGATGDGNDLPGQAVILPLDEVRTAALETYDDVDFFEFEVTEAGLYLIEIDAKPDTVPFATGHVNSVVTLYDKGDGGRRGENDDPWPPIAHDSELITELTPGPYILRVSDHCYWRELEFADLCASSGVFLEPTYAVKVGRWSSQDPGLLGPGEGSGVTFVPNGDAPSGYDRPLIWGHFTPSTVESYSITMPADWSLPAASGTRPEWQIGTFPGGNRGSGATTETGRVWLSDRADPMDPAATVLGALDASVAPGRQLVVPATGPTGMPGGSFSQTDEVFLHVASADTTPGAGAFFLLRVAGVESVPWENEPNNSALGASAMPGAGLQFAVGGELPVGDEDWYALDLVGQGIPVNYYVDARCEARLRGSGLEALTVQLVEEDGATMAYSGTETGSSPAIAGGGSVLLPAGASGFFLRVSRQGQAAGNDGVFYRCELTFLAP